MAFADVLFPLNISYGSQGGPEFFTTVQANKGKFEQRSRNIYAPTWKWNVVYGIKTALDYLELYNFFLVRAGKWQSFRYQDRHDHVLVHEPIAIADGAQTVFQTTKTYRSGGGALVRTLTKLVSGTTHIYANDVAVPSGVAVNLLTGEWTFDDPPTKGVLLSVSATFHTAARFDIDYLPSVYEAVGAEDELILRIENIPIVEAPGE